MAKKLSEANSTILDLQSANKEVFSKQIKKQLATPFGEEVKKIEQLRNLTQFEEYARNVWLFSFY